MTRRGGHKDPNTERGNDTMGCNDNDLDPRMYYVYKGWTIIRDCVREMGKSMMSRHIHRSLRRNRILMFPQTRHSLQLRKKVQSSFAIKIGVYHQPNPKTKGSKS